MKEQSESKKSAEGEKTTPTPEEIKAQEAAAAEAKKVEEAKKVKEKEEKEAKAKAAKIDAEVKKVIKNALFSKVNPNPDATLLGQRAFVAEAASQLLVDGVWEVDSVTDSKGVTTQVLKIVK